MLTVNALTAADGVLIPMQCEYYALEGLSSLLNTIEQVRDSVNPELEVYGILRTMFDPRINLSNEVSMQLIKHFRSTRFSAPSCRATFASPRRRASAGRCCCMIAHRAAPSPTWRLPAKYCVAKTRA